MCVCVCGGGSSAISMVTGESPETKAGFMSPKASLPVTLSVHGVPIAAAAAAAAGGS